MKEKFMTLCTGCDGTGIFEEVYTTFENETKYRNVACGCEKGKEFDWDKLEAEIKATKEAIEKNEMTQQIIKQMIQEAFFEGMKENVFHRVGKFIEAEKKAIELEMYLAELDEL